MGLGTLHSPRSLPCRSVASRRAGCYRALATTSRVNKPAATTSISTSSTNCRTVTTASAAPADSHRAAPVRTGTLQPKRARTLAPSATAQLSHSSYYGDPQPESVAVRRNPQNDERDACGVGFLARLSGNREHAVLTEAVSSLGCVEHRGACSADNDSGDGAGIMSEIPWKMINRWLGENNKEQLEEGSSAVGMVFLPQDSQKQATGRNMIHCALEREQLRVVAWRDPPVDKDVLGSYAAAAEPKVEQVMVKDDVGGRNRADIERALFLAKKAAEREVIEANDSLLREMVYICSLSTSTIVYKGMLRSAVLGSFYLDLQDSDYETSWCIYHRRFSTNTNPAWPLAQPFRLIGHNGEINTLMGNLNWVRTREGDFQHSLWHGREEDLRPVVDPGASDSANLDRLAELLVQTDRPVEETMMLLVPEAHENNPTLDQNYPEARDFYDFYAGTQEAWDGPALLVFSDGRKLGCRLDRNGLRPARFWYTSDTVYVASEVGVQPSVIEQAKEVKSKGRLGPGEMVVVDTETGEFKENDQVAREVAQLRPYGEWMQQRRHIHPPAPKTDREIDDERLVALQAAAGWSAEDLSMVLESMTTDGKEPVFSMGDDTPLSPLSERPHPLFNYFKQRFAQVTNPAIDPLREGTVMSLEMCLGGRGDLLKPSMNDANQLVIDSPVLMEDQLEFLKDDVALSTKTLPAFYNCQEENGLKSSLDDLCRRAEEAVQNGSKCLVISDRDKNADENHPAIPALLAIGAVHQHLIGRKIRSKCSIVSECMHAHSTHHLATLVGYGAEAVTPWLAFESARAWRLSKRTQNLIEKGKVSPVSVEEAQHNVVKALNAGLKKILSKIGIGLLSSYHAAQIFECFGLGNEVVDYAFTGTDAPIGGLSLEEVSAEVSELWQSAMPSMSKLPASGFFQAKPGLEYHGNNQEMSKLLHKAIGLGGKEPSEDAYELYQEHRQNRPVTTLRDCLDLESDRDPIDVSEVESAADIVSHFCTGGMSLGAISRECHEIIGVAMNRVGGKSNSGEGGEDPDRYIELEDVDEEGNSPTFPHLRGLRNGDYASSAIKQVASGRFGVTPEFLAASKQLEIKIAQGAKPGEGGQLPGKKVSPYIAMLRRSKPGVPLISPPPHHDIYSIEDLAQLIFDLHQANPQSQVSVKLVASEGIGTVASGVAKANADIIQVSGHDGGTGASPVSSIKHAGAPFELGLMEAHQSLLDNGLRERVVLRCDGGIRSGFDVVQAALLGADEYGFGTISMIATGCILARVCHTNNCPVGVASQREELRARFPGAPSDLVNFFHFVAEEVRQTLARMGYRSLDEIVGRADLLRQRENSVTKTNHLDLSYLTRCPGLPESTCSQRIAQEAHSNGPVFDNELLADKDIVDAIENEGDVTKDLEVTNMDRSVGGRLGPMIAGKYGDEGFAGTINLNFTGSGGQSFGAWLVKGMHFSLEGEANDYVGKGMAGGSIAIRPPSQRLFKAEESSLVGNTCLYGATGGQLFVNGRAGERFAVRNSMAEAVVEGTGDHCCEYMTGGCVVVLGSVGRNTAAGMTGGITYIYDENDELPERLNDEIVTMQRVQSQAGERQLRQVVQDHAQRTGSERAYAMLRSWDDCMQHFWQLVPPSEADTPEARPEPVAGSGEPAPAAAATRA